MTNGIPRMGRRGLRITLLAVVPGLLLVAGVVVAFSVPRYESRLEEAIRTSDTQEAVGLIRSGRVDLDRRVLLRGPEPEATFVHLAAWYDLPQVIEALDRAGADMEAQIVMNNERPIHTAVDAGAYESLRALIRAGVDLEAKDEFSTTPLMSCVIGDDLDGAVILIDAGADVHYALGDGRDLLFWARSDAMRRLLRDAVAGDQGDHAGPGQ